LHIAHDKVLSGAEVETLMESLHKRALRTNQESWANLQLDELIVVALLSSGLRNSEFCSMAVNDTILWYGDSVFAIRRPASRKRTVYIPSKVSSLVQQYVETVRPRFLPYGMDPKDFTKPLVFSEQRHPFDRTSMYRRVVKILTEAGLGERANVQLLRHTYGYLAYLRTGGNLLFVQRQLGHAHTATTAMYAKLVEESYSDLAERILPAAGRGPEAAVGKRFGSRPVTRFDCEID
jgi:integrase/recombinase XerD